MALPITVLYKPGGSDVREFAPILESPNWSTSVPGGFASFSFSLRGWHNLDYLAAIDAYYEDALVWEGRIEDFGWTIDEDEQVTTVDCFGYHRRLDDVSVQRIWIMRDIDWREHSQEEESFVGDAARTQWEAKLGSFDIGDRSLRGVRWTGRRNSASMIGAAAVYYRAPSGVNLTRLLGTYSVAEDPISGLGTPLGGIWSSANGTSWTAHTTSLAVGDFDQALVANAIAVAIGTMGDTGFQAFPADESAFSGMRLLGTSLTEDVSGGMYGGKLLRDVLGLVPGLGAGSIDEGSEFSVEELHRAVRDSARSVVDEVSRYYVKEWAVWEGGRFDWKAVDETTPDYLIRIADLIDLDLSATSENVARTYHVLYTDAGSEEQRSQSATATAQRNPFAKQGLTKDLLFRAGFPMTDNTASQLAGRLAETGSYVPAAGTIVLPLTLAIEGLTGPTIPAALLRAGCNVLLPELPVDDIGGGRDGRTILRVVSTETNLAENTVTLEVDSAPRSLDVLLARLAEATRQLSV